MKEKTNIMVDIETLATSPSALVRSISLVAFNFSREESLDELMSRVLTVWVRADEQLDMGREVDEDTLAWWNTRREKAENSLEQQNAEWVLSESPEDMGVSDALDIIQAFVNDVAPNGLIYARGANFDFPILESLARNAGRSLPWSTWKQACSKSIIRFVCQDDLETEKALVNGLISNHSSGYDVCVEVMKLRQVYAALEAE